MKKLFKTLALTVALMTFVSCGSSVNIDRINELCQKEELSSSDINFLIDQFEVLIKKYGKMGYSEMMEALQKGDQEVAAAFAVVGAIENADLTDAQEERVDMLRDKYGN